MEKFLSGRRVLVVGGSGGIGASVSVALARHGAQLCLHGGHNQVKLDAVAVRAREYTEYVDTMLYELNCPDDAARLLEFGGPVDVLIVCFGPWEQKSVLGTGPEQWERMVGLNLTLPAILVSGVLARMVRNSYGRIVLFGGPRSDRNTGYRDIGAYGAAKHGLASLVRSVALQHAAHNVRCNMICPGYVDTEYYDDEVRLELQNRQPSGRLISAEEISSLVVSLLRPASDAISGAIIPVDFGV